MMMSLSGGFTYLAIAVAAVVEGEFVYIGASALVMEGQLHPLGVIAAGAIGAMVGDQAYFYLLRSRLTKRLRNLPTLRRRAAPLLAYVRAHDSLAVLLIRFAPGFRIALAAACAFAGVSPAKFSALNAATAVLWAILVLVLVAWAGPASVSAFGLPGWHGAVAMAVGIGVLMLIVKRSLALFFGVNRSNGMARDDDMPDSRSADPQDK
jgi:membrane protein DedA with SNARE-associated domain